MSAAKAKSGQFVKKLTKRLRKTSAASKEHIRENLIEPAENIKSVRLQVFEWILMALAVILFSAIQIVWYNNTYSTQAFIPGGTYYEGTLGKINSMNPLYATTNSEKTLAKLLFSSLTKTDVSGFTSMGLAESVRSEDSKVWTVVLRDGLNWSDNQPLTSADVVWTFEMLQSTQSKTVYAGVYDGIIVEATTPLELKFTLRSPYSYFPSSLDFPILPQHILGEIAPEELYESSFSTNPVGSGPFKLQSIQTVASGNEQKVLLDRNDNYTSQIFLDNFAIHTYQDRDALRRSIDFLQVTATADLDSTTAPTNSNVLARQSAVNSGMFIFFNCSSTRPTGNAKLRQALSRAIDVEALRNDLHEPYPLQSPIIRSQLSLNYPSVPAHNPDEATRIASDISRDSTPVINIAVSDDPASTTIANSVQEALDGLGFESQITPYTAQDLILSIIRPRSYDILVYEIDMGTDSDPFAYYHSASMGESGLNLSNYRNAIVDDALLTARVSQDAKLRAAKYDTFLRTWANDVPSIPVYQASSTYYYSKTARPFSENVNLVSPLDRFNDVAYWSVQQDTRLRTP